MRAIEMLRTYDRLMRQLDEAATRSDWECLAGLQDRVEDLQKQFERLPAVQKKRPDVEARLRALFTQQQSLTQHVSRAKQETARRLRKIQVAKKQQHGYQQTNNYFTSPLFYDRKN